VLFESEIPANVQIAVAGGTAQQLRSLTVQLSYLHHPNAPQSTTDRVLRIQLTDEVRGHRPAHSISATGIASALTFRSAPLSFALPPSPPSSFALQRDHYFLAYIEMDAKCFAAMRDAQGIRSDFGQWPDRIVEFCQKVRTSPPTIPNPNSQTAARLPHSAAQGPRSLGGADEKGHALAHVRVDGNTYSAFVTETCDGWTFLIQEETSYKVQPLIVCCSAAVLMPHCRCPDQCCADRGGCTPLACGCVSDGLCAERAYDEGLRRCY
jgi:hypothetical protein